MANSKEYSKNWQDKNREHLRVYKREYSKNYKYELSEDQKKKYYEAHKLRMKTDPNYKLRRQMRSRLNMAMKIGQKGGSAIKDLGCSIQELRVYLESKFEPGMTWENHGKSGWHIDHIRPLSSFDLSNPEEVKLACHYTNLQPLWAKDNYSKGYKVE